MIYLYKLHKMYSVPSYIFGGDNLKNAQKWIASHKSVAICFLAIVVLLALTVFFFNSMFHSTMDALDRQASHLNSVSCTQLRNEIDSVLSYSSELVSMICSNQVVQHFTGYGKLSSSAEHYNLYELSQSISTYRNMIQSNSLLLDFVLYYPNSDVLLNMQSYYRTLSYYSLHYGPEDISYEDWQKLISTSIPGRFVAEASTDTELAYIQSIDHSVIPGANIILFFNRQAIETMLMGLAQDNYKVAMQLDGILIAPEFDPELYSAVMSAVYTGAIPDDTADWSVSIVSSNSVRSVTFYICQNENAGLSHIPGVFLRKFYSISIILLLIIAVCTLVLTLAMVILPILNKYRKNKPVQGLGGSTTVLRDAIDFVFSHNQDAPEESEWSVVKDSLLDLLLNSDESHEQIIDTLNKHNIVFCFPFYMIVVFASSKPIPVDSFTELTQRCNERNESIVSACFPIGHGRFTALFNLKDAGTTYVDTVEFLYDSIRKKTNAEITVYIGSIQEGSANIYRSYKDAVALSEYKIFTGSNSILDQNSFTPGNDEYYYPMDVELSLISATARGDKEKVTLILDTLHDENFNKRQLSPYIAKLLLNELAGTTLKITKGTDSSFPENPAAMVLKCRTVEEMFGTLRRIYENVCDLHQDDILIKRKAEFEDYILTHFTDSGFSQSQMADDLSLSQNYLSVQFKNCFGVNMNTFVNTLRAEKASGMLKDTDLPVQDIAVKCGFSNGDALARVFKKKYGITPTDYRNGICANTSAATE